MKPYQSRFFASKFVFTSSISGLTFCALITLSPESVAAPDVSIAAPRPAAPRALSPSALSPSAAATRAAAEEKLGNSIQKALGVPGVEVRVFTAKNGTTTAMLSGNLGAGKEAEVEKLLARAEKLVPSVVARVVSLVTPTPEEKPAGAPDAITTAIWTRTFAETSVSSTQRVKTETAPGDSATGDAASGDAAGETLNPAETRAQALAKALNELHGNPDPPLIRAQGASTFYLRGPRSKVVALKRDLLKIDANWPQVQLDLWTVQVSGSPQAIARDTAWIRERFSAANQAMQIVQSALGDAAQNPHYMSEADELLSTQSGGLLQRIGFNPDCRRPLSLTETLLFLGLQNVLVNPSDGTVLRDESGKILTSADLGRLRRDQNFTPGSRVQLLPFGEQQPWNDHSRVQTLARVYVLAQLRERIAARFNEEVRKNPQALVVLNVKYRARDKNGKLLPTADPEKLLPGLSTAYKSNANSDRAGIKQFAEAVHEFNTLKTEDRPVASLRAATAAGDRLLKAVTDAFAYDMQDMFLKPILDEVALKRAGSSDSGVALTGQTRMVVSSRIETGISPTITSYVDTTRPKPLDAKFLSDVLGKSAPAEEGAAPPANAAGLGAVLTHLSNSQLVLAGALLAQPEPEITKISPGVAINVRPTVLPDGGSARLQLDFNFGVATTVNNPASAAQRRTSVPASAIESSHVATDITVSAFDLFTVSSFSLESSHPRSRYLPIVGSIPLLGELIKKPRKNKVTRHESIVLVNATILPRIMDLAHFYGE